MTQATKEARSKTFGGENGSVHYSGCRAWRNAYGVRIGVECGRGVLGRGAFGGTASWAGIRLIFSSSARPTGSSVALPAGAHPCDRQRSPNLGDAPQVFP